MVVVVMFSVAMALSATGAGLTGGSSAGGGGDRSAVEGSLCCRSAIVSTHNGSGQHQTDDGNGEKIIYLR